MKTTYDLADGETADALTLQLVPGQVNVHELTVGHERLTFILQEKARRDTDGQIDVLLHVPPM